MATDFDVQMIVCKANVILCGASGHGKSSLINAIAGKTVAETSQTSACTMDIAQYEIDDVTYFDTRGLEMQAYEKTRATLEKFIQSRNADSDPNQHVHLAYLVISEEAARLEDSQKSLKKLFDDMKIPVVVVLTKAYDTYKDQSEFYKHVVKELPNTTVVRVNSQEKRIGKHTIWISGLDELVDVTCSKIPDAQQRAFLAAQAISEAGKMSACKKIIAAYACSAAIISTIPFAGLPLALPSLYGMFISLGKVFGYAFERDQLVSLMSIISLSTQVSAAASSILVVELLDFIPVVGWIVSGAVSATAVSVLFYLSGISYAETMLKAYRDKVRDIEEVRNILKLMWTKNKNMDKQEAIEFMKKFD